MGGTTSSASACEMLLILLTPIGSPFLHAHVTGTDHDGGCRVGFVYEKHYDIASAEGLAESGIGIVACNMPSRRKAVEETCEVVTSRRDDTPHLPCDVLCHCGRRRSGRGGNGIAR